MNKRIKYISIFIILISVSCNRFSNKKLYFESIKNDKYFIEILNSQNEEIKIYIKDANNENPGKVGFWKNNFDYNNSKADSLYQIIEKIKISKFTDINFSELNINELKKIRNIKISETEKRLIYNEIIEYRNIIIKIIPDTSSLFNNDFIFNDKKIENSLNLISENTNGLKFIAVLSKIEVFIKISQIKLNQYLIGNVDCCGHGYYLLSAFCIPVSKTIFQGNDYNSKIIFGSGDSTSRYWIVIDNDTVKNNLDFYNFKEKARKDSGKVNIDAKFLLESPSTGKIIEYPFTIKYEVVR